MSAPQRPPTLADVARAASVSTYTASVALRGGMGKVRAATMARVVAAAERLGYRPNGPAALLARQQRRDISPARTVRVGVFHEAGREDPFSRRLREAGPLRGLETVPVGAGQPGELAALLKSAWSRGVEGFCLPSGEVPWSAEEFAAADWSRFAVVQRDRSDQLRDFHLVRVSAFDFMLLSLEKVLARGYRRVGVLLVKSSARRDDLARIGAVTAMREEALPRGSWLGIFRRSPGELKSGAVVPTLRAWLQRHRPEALVAFPFSWEGAVRAAGFRIPEDIALAAVLTHPRAEGLGHISGCDAAEDEVAMRCLDRLLDLLRRGERGRARRPLEDVIEPEWFEGETLGERRVIHS